MYQRLPQSTQRFGQDRYTRYQKSRALFSGVKGGFALAEQERDAWEVLGIPPTADADRIREAYLAQVRRHHPDQFRMDPVRYRQQEERMKTINEAYQWALHNPPQAKSPGRGHAGQSPTAGTEPPIICPEHQYQAVRRCKGCQQPICLGCLGVRQSLCNRDYRRLKTRQMRGRAFKEWVPLIAIIGGMRAFGLPGLDVALASLIYIAWLGFRFLRTRHWFGCLALLLLPYSLILAGIWSLIDSLRDWNRPFQETSKTS